MIYCGILENKPYQEDAQFQFFRRWLHEGYQIEQGESFADFKNRVRTGVYDILTELDNEQKDHAIVVCHSGYIRAVMHTFIDAQKPFFDWEVPNALGYTVYFAKNTTKLSSYQL